MELQNGQLSLKKILITGGSDGLGLALARKLKQLGTEVIVIGRNKEKLEKIQEEGIQTFQCDVSDYNQVEKVISQIEKIDILVNSAGVYIEGPLETNTPEQITTALDINVKGTIYVTHAVLPRMKAQNSGTIVNMSSTVGFEARPNISVYTATKYAVTGFTESLKLELTDTDIKVVGIYPGAIQTNFRAKGSSSVGGLPTSSDNWMTADEVADVIVFILQRPKNMLIDKIVLRDMKK